MHSGRLDLCGRLRAAGGTLERDGLVDHAQYVRRRAWPRRETRIRRVVCFQHGLHRGRIHVRRRARLRTDLVAMEWAPLAGRQSVIQDRSCRGQLHRGQHVPRAAQGVVHIRQDLHSRRLARIGGTRQRHHPIDPTSSPHERAVLHGRVMHVGVKLRRGCKQRSRRDHTGAWRAPTVDPNRLTAPECRAVQVQVELVRDTRSSSPTQFSRHTICAWRKIPCSSISSLFTDVLRRDRLERLGPKAADRTPFSGHIGDTTLLRGIIKGPQLQPIRNFAMPPVGIEPTTFGLKVRCSAS